MAGRKRASTSSSSSYESSQSEKKAGAKLLLGTLKNGRASITPPMKVSLGCDVIKIRAIEPSSPSYDVSPVESTTLESKDKRISQIPGSEGHRTNGQAMLLITRAATSTRLQTAYLKASGSG